MRRSLETIIRRGILGALCLTAIGGLLLATIGTIGLVSTSPVHPQAPHILTHSRQNTVTATLRGLKHETPQPRVQLSAWPADNDSGWKTLSGGSVEYNLSESDHTLYLQPTGGNSEGTFPANFTFQYGSFIHIKAKGTLHFLQGQSLALMFAYNDSLTDISGLSHFDVSNVTDMSNMFQFDSSLASLTGLEDWNTSNVTNMSGMFNGDLSLTSLAGLEGWKTGNVTDMSNMFNDDPKLSSLTALQHWDTSNVTDMNGMFYENSALTSLAGLEGWKTGNVTDMTYMFNADSNLSSLSALQHWDTSKVQKMPSMFQGDPKLSSLTDLQHWDTSKVTDMSTMFNGDSSLTSLAGLEDWKTGNVTNMSNMFNDDPNLSSLTDLQHWDTSNVTDMSTMFNGDSSLTSLAGLEEWDTGNVTDMPGMFQDDPNLSSLTDLQHWDTSKVTDMPTMFDGDSSLTSLAGLEDWKTGNVTDMSGMFYGCSHLSDIAALDHWDTSQVQQFINQAINSQTEQFEEHSIFDKTKITDLSALRNWNFTQWDETLDGQCSDDDPDCGEDYLLQGVNWQKIGIPAADRGGVKVVKSIRSQSIQLISEDGQVGPVTASDLATEMTNQPQHYSQSRVYLRYTPSWVAVFNPNGGMGSTPIQMVKLTDSLTLPESPFFRFGYTFAGWSTQPDDTTTLRQPGTSFRPANPTLGQKYTLYAQWKKIVSPITPPTTNPGGSMLPGWVQTDSSGTTGLIRPGGTSEASFTNKYEPGSATVTFSLTKLLDGDVPTRSFNFDLYSSNGALVQTVQSVGSSILFKPITFTQSGTYTYFVHEASHFPLIDSDSHTVQITVTVKDDPAHAGQLLATVQYVGDTTFQNTSKPASLTIRKNVAGTTATDKNFTIRVQLLDRKQNLITGTYSSVQFKNGVGTVTLTAGKSKTITGLPAGTKYSVSEPDTTMPAGYKLTSTTDSTGTLTAAGSATTTLTNTYSTTPAHVAVQLAKRILLGPNNTLFHGQIPEGSYRFDLCEMKSGTCGGISTTSNLSNGSIIFPQLTYTTPGTHTYRVQEEDGKQPGVIYDTGKRDVTIKVSDNGSGKLVATVTYACDPTASECQSNDPRLVTNRMPQVGSMMPRTGQSGVLPSVILGALIILGGAISAFLSRKK